MKQPGVWRRLLPHPALSAALVAVWLLLSNRLTVGGLVLALLFAVLVPLFTSRFWPDRPKLRFGPALAGYLAIVLWDIVVANFHVAWVILFHRNRDLRRRWLVIPLSVRSPEAITTLAGTISLTPGTVSSDVSADGRHLLVHALDLADSAVEVARIKARYETRLLRIFP
ncbi:Na+/H+ antiporter subunit E [Phenylobacterium sp.]|uniref:Na+/H+ antiporter subunit E n=1 Tax=Phenylobacterium sp. TaxID=1871053 RepID=UPI00289F38B7|nr:Na+/H+ antiporter subunit E [Phenylobacterium sp.]